MPIVEADNGQSYDFPEGTTNAQMTAYLMKVAPPKEQKSPLQNFKDVASQNLASNPFTAPLSIVSKMHPIDDARDLVQGAVQGTVNAGALASQGMASLANAFGANLKGAPDVSNIAAPIGSGKDGFESNLARGLGKYVPYGAAAEIGAPASILGQLIAGGASGGANATPGQSNLFGLLPSGKAGGAIEGALDNALPGGALKTLEKLRPSNLFKTQLSPAQLQANIDSTKGVPINIGRILQNPELASKYENVLTSIPFSGAKNDLQSSINTSKQQANDLGLRILGETHPDTLNMIINQQGENALKNTLGLDSLEDANTQLDEKGSNLLTNLFGQYDAKNNMQDLNYQLNDLHAQRQSEKQNLYKDVEDTADSDSNFEMRASEVQQVAKSINPVVYNSLENNFKDIFDRLAGNKKTDPYYDSYQQKNIPSQNMPVSLKEANLLKARLNQYGKTVASSPDMVSRNAAGSFFGLANKVDNGISQSIKDSNNTVLSQKFDVAQTNYAQNYAPFLDKDIYKYISGNADPDKMVSDLLSTGKDEELSTRLSKLSDLSPQLSQGLAKTYFNRSQNHKQLSKLIDELGANQMDSLVQSVQSQRILHDFSHESKIFQHFYKAINGDGTINHDFLSRKIEDLKKNPSQFQNFVPSHTTRQQLIDYSKLHRMRQDFSKSIDNDGNVNPVKFSTLTEKLASQIDKYDDYVPDKKLRDDLVKFRNLQSMDKDNPMFNAPTGKTNKDFLGIGSVFGAKAGGAAAGASLGGLPGAVIGAIAAPALLLGGGKYLAKNAVSEQVRQNLVKEMLNPRQKFNTPKNVIGAQTLAQSLLNSQQNRGQ